LRQKKQKGFEAMTIHFAAAVDCRRAALGLAQARVVLGHPANDNPVDATKKAVLHAALRHFAKHGLGAAAHARDAAEQAFFAGDRENYRRWLAVCRALDSRMAAGLTHQSGSNMAAKPSEFQG
jgi:hypothetical protein